MSRQSYLDRVPGFVEFHLLKGPEAEDHTLYASHTVWQTKSAFEAWTKSEEFRAAHARAGNPHFFSLTFSCCVRATSNQLVPLSRHLRGSVYQALSALADNPFALSLVYPAAKKAAWPGEFRRDTSRIHRWPATRRPSACDAVGGSQGFSSWCRPLIVQIAV
jgi:hypothetical protein